MAKASNITPKAENKNVPKSSKVKKTAKIPAGKGPGRPEVKDKKAAVTSMIRQSVIKQFSSLRKLKIWIATKAEEEANIRIAAKKEQNKVSATGRQ